MNGIDSGGTQSTPIVNVNIPDTFKIKNVENTGLCIGGSSTLKSKNQLIVDFAKELVMSNIMSHTTDRSTARQYIYDGIEYGKMLYEAIIAQNLYIKIYNQGKNNEYIEF